MSTDMFPQGFIDMMTGAQWHLVASTGETIGPFASCYEAAEERKKQAFPSEWAYRRTIAPKGQ